MAKPVRMADIAEKLDISVVSVSKALAGKSGVSEEMRARIVALARQMGYEGTRVHGELAGTGNIGVLVSDRFFHENSFYTSLYRSLVLGSGNEGFTCMMEIVTLEAEQKCDIPALVAGRKVDGLIFMGNLSPAYLRRVGEAGLPSLMLDRASFVPGPQGHRLCRQHPGHHQHHGPVSGLSEGPAAGGSHSPRGVAAGRPGPGWRVPPHLPAGPAAGGVFMQLRRGGL